MSGAMVTLLTSNSPLAAVADPAEVDGFKIGRGTVYTAVPSVVTAQGGGPPYTYTWSRVSGSTAIFPENSTSASTLFYAYFSALGTKAAVYKCTVLDALAATVDTNTVTITLDTDNSLP